MNQSELFDDIACSVDPDPEKAGERDDKLAREFDRMRGILRFSPVREKRAADGSGGGTIYVARCAPDTFVLPLLADHFFARFGETPWAIIDEKRGLVLIRERGKRPALRRATAAGETACTGNGGGVPDGGNSGRCGTAPAGGEAAVNGDDGNGDDGWEKLWRKYHKAINNGERENPALQKQFMPSRYWKYLPEMNGCPEHEKKHKPQD